MFKWLNKFRKQKEKEEKIEETIEIVYCEDCDHCEFDPERIKTWEFASCKHPKNLQRNPRLGSIELVMRDHSSAEPEYVPIYENCAAMRTVDNSFCCGPKGKWFEPKVGKWFKSKEETETKE